MHPCGPNLSKPLYYLHHRVLDLNVFPRSFIDVSVKHRHCPLRLYKGQQGPLQNIRITINLQGNTNNHIGHRVLPFGSPNLYKSLCSLHHRIPNLGESLPTINYSGDTRSRLGGKTPTNLSLSRRIKGTG